MGEFLVATLSKWLNTDEFTLMYQMIGFLGWFNVALTMMAGALFTLRRVNKYAYKNKNETLKKILKPLSKIHPGIGIILLISAFLHGDLALGSIFRIHTGPLAWWVLLVMMLVAILGKQFKVIPQWIKIHRVLAVLMVISVALHLFGRSLLNLLYVFFSLFTNH